MRNTAIVTGAARGIGLATTDIFLAEGRRVAMIDRDADELHKVAADRENVVPIVCDVSDPDQVAAMRDHAEHLPDARISGKVQDLGRDLLRIETDLTVGDPDDWPAERFSELRTDLATVAGHLAAKYLG